MLVAIFLAPYQHRNRFLAALASVIGARWRFVPLPRHISDRSCPDFPIRLMARTARCSG